MRVLNVRIAAAENVIHMREAEEEGEEEGDNFGNRAIVLGFGRRDNR